MSESSHKKARFLGADEIADTITAIAARAPGDFALCGGCAMQVYGSDRLTRDVDFISQGQPPADLVKVRDLSFGGVAGTLRGMPVDWIVRSDDYAALYVEALATSIMVPEIGCRLVQPEYLVAMKMVAGRPKDEEDALFLLGASGDTEWWTLAIDLARAKIHRLLGAYAADDFMRLAEEAAWRRSRL